MKKRATQTPKERRTGKSRINVNLLVEYNHQGSYLFDFCNNLSEGGVFLATENPEDVGEVVELTFTFPKSRKRIRAQGRVMWVQEPVPGRPDLASGAGIQFTHIEASDRQVLIDFLNNQALSASA